MNFDVTNGWTTLPRRLYLDTGLLQTLFDYGEQVWENQEFVAMERDRSVPDLKREVDALGSIMAVNERAGFEFVVTDASIREVDAQGIRTYATWVRDVLDNQQTVRPHRPMVPATVGL